MVGLMHEVYGCFQSKRTCTCMDSLVFVTNLSVLNVINE